MAAPTESVDQYGWMHAPDSNFEYFFGGRAKNTTFAFTNRDGENTDFVISLGLSGYFVVGGGAEYQLNISEISRRMGWDTNKK